MSTVTDHAAIASLSVFDLIADVPGHLLRLKPTMIDISHALERAATRTATPGRVFAGFQRLSLYARSQSYYAALSSAGYQVWVFGVPDAEVAPLPNVTVVPIAPEAPLVQEWFVVVDSPEFGAALLTADVSGFLLGDASRRFMGLWSAEAVLVRAASDRIASALALPGCDWPIGCATSLAAFTTMSSELLALHEERRLGARV